MRNGPGRMFRPDGTLQIDGQFKNGRPSIGSLYGVDGTSLKYRGGLINFEGNWTPHGKGELFDADRYEGNFSRGKKHGLGKIFYRNGTRFDGNFANDKKTGQGKESDADGRIHFEGNYADDRRIVGKMSFPQDNVVEFYEGEFNDLPHGQGTITWRDGATFTGDFKQGRNNKLKIEIT